MLHDLPALYADLQKAGWGVPEIDHVIYRWDFAQPCIELPEAHEDPTISFEHRPLGYDPKDWSD